MKISLSIQKEGLIMPRRNSSNIASGREMRTRAAEEKARPRKRYSIGTVGPDLWISDRDQVQLGKSRRCKDTNDKEDL